MKLPVKSRTERMIRAAWQYDYENRNRLDSWTRVPASQVLRLLIGAGLLKAEDADGA